MIVRDLEGVELSTSFDVMILLKLDDSNVTRCLYSEGFILTFRNIPEEILDYKVVAIREAQEYLHIIVEKIKN